MNGGLFLDSPLGECMRFIRGKIAKPIDTNANRKARKERARMLTRQREEELRAQRLSLKNAG